jgi:pyruvate formate-lyase/glycerol dehydratase family glycyl radical enzyme
MDMIDLTEEILPLQHRQVSGSIALLRERIRKSPLQMTLERSLLYRKSYGKTGELPVVIRRARMLEHVLSNMTIRIEPQEILVGGRTPYPRMGIPATEGDVEWLSKELDSLGSRSQDPFHISEADKSIFRETIYPFFRGKTLKDYIFEHLPEEIRVACEDHLFTLNQKDHSQGHIVPDVQRWLSLGIDGISDEVRAARRSTVEVEKRHFYDAVSISLEAAKTFISRYGDLASSMELHEIADICRHLSSKPPRSFREAVQSTWFLIVMLILESIGNAFSPGRLDQILYSYYRKDVEKGLLSDEEAVDVIEAFYLKLNEVVVVRPEEQARYFAGFPMGFNVLLGGQDEQGRDATNELSYLFLKAEADLLLPQPNLSVRLHRNSPEHFLTAVAHVIGKGSGMPQVFNDEAIIPALIDRGFERNDAYNYGVIGCVELCIPGKFLGLSNAAMMNMARLFEVSLREKPYESFEALEGATLRNLQRAVELMAEGSNVVDRAHASVLPTPLLSSVIHNCVEKGVDVSRGGALYNFTGPQAVGIANIADCMFAVKTLLYDNDELGYGELIEMLDADFEGFEDSRERIRCRIPKYGNGIEEVDELARKWSAAYCREVEKYENPRGGKFQPGMYTVSAHVPLGKVVGTTPDGRLRGEPLADGGLSPMRGRDVRSPLAVIQSASRVDQHRATNGTLLNLKFHPSVFQGDGALQSFVGVLRGITAHDLFHVQFNVISSDTLREAQRKPDEHRNLVIRVAGYSAYFTELNKALQNDIIERTEYR